MHDIPIYNKEHEKQGGVFIALQAYYDELIHLSELPRYNNSPLITLAVDLSLTARKLESDSIEANINGLQCLQDAADQVAGIASSQICGRIDELIQHFSEFC